MLANNLNFTWNKDALSIEGLNINMGSKPLIINSDLKISFGDRIGLLGRNGCGKTTLFKYISDLGKDNNTWSVYEVEQELPPSNMSITNIVLASHLERGKMWDRRSELEMIEELSDKELEEYNEICEKLEAMNCDADPPRAKKILKGLGFLNEDLEKSLNTFSGGWKARVALACGLFMEPDMLLLDEPTNHLDLNAVLWLSEFCKTWKKTLVVITHNGYFAHNICNSIYHIDNQKINSYKCTYNKFMKMKKINDEKAQKDWEKVEKEYIKLKSKGTPKDKKAAEDYLSKKESEGVKRPGKPYRPRFFFENEKDYKEGTSLLSLSNVGFSYGSLIEGNQKEILHDVDFALYPQSRSVLVGANGAGKSTLLKLLTGELEPSMGESNRKTRLSVKYFNQHFYHDLPPNMTPIEYVSSQTLSSKMDVVRKLLGASGLEGEAHSRKIDTLSGGQKARVYFAGLIISEPDILLLDEPTNHLDMETSEGLLNGLKEYPGAVVIVSHDLEFLEEIGTEVWLIEDKQVKRLGEGIDGLEVYVDKVMSDLDV